MQDKHELPKTAEGSNTNLENIAKNRLRGRPNETPKPPKTAPEDPAESIR